LYSYHERRPFVLLLPPKLLFLSLSALFCVVFGAVIYRNLSLLPPSEIAFGLASNLCMTLLKYSNLLRANVIIVVMMMMIQ